MIKGKGSKRNDDGSVKLIRKANELVEARYKFDIWETRIFAKMLTMIKPGDKDLKDYEIFVGDLLKDFGLQDAGDNYEYVRQAGKKLLSKTINLEKETPEGLMWFSYPMLARASGKVDQKDNNVIRVQFHPDLKPYLLELQERYLQYDIRNLWGLNSIYSVRMYELLKQYERIGKRKFTLADLKNRLAIEPTEYLKYSHFKDKVLLKAQGDLGNHTDIAFSFEEHKTGRQITSYTFHIYSNRTKREKKELPVKLSEENNGADQVSPDFVTSIYDQVKGWGVSEEKLTELVSQYGAEAVKNGISCTLSGIKKGKVKENTGGYFIKAVQEGWKSPEQVKQEKAEMNKKEKEDGKHQDTKQLQELEKMFEDLNASRRVEANEVIKELTQENELLVGEAIEKIISHKLIKSSLERQTGLILEGLEIEEWRNNKPLRDAIIRQIEIINPTAFKEIQLKYDGKIKSIYKQIGDLKHK